VLGSGASGTRRIYHLGRDGAILAQLDDPGSTDLLVVDPATGELFVRTNWGIEVLEGTSFSTLWPASPGDVQSFVLDDRYVYAVFADGHLGRLPRHGGSEEVLLHGGRVIAVGLDTAAIYALDCNLSSGQILQLPR
jgi:hypothetical protein